MMRAILSSFLILVSTTLMVAAKPLITNSEETLARICLAQEETYDRLVDACTEALRDSALTDNQKGEIYVALGDAYFWQDLDEDAEKAYRKATEIDPQNLKAWNGLGWSLRSTAGPDAALEAFEASLAIDVSVQGLGGKASTARELGIIDAEESRDLLRAVLSIDPEYAWAIREIAWSFHEDGDFDAALASFDEALALDADDMNATYGKGRAALDGGQPDVALDLFNTTLAANPNSFSVRVYRIIALRDLDRNAQAIRDADRVIVDFPEADSGYIQKGRALMALHRRSEAIETFQTAIEVLGPNNAIYYWHADALIEDGRFEEALKVVELAIAAEGSDHSDLLLKSYIHIELEDWTEARAASEASIETGYEDPWAHYYIAISLVHDGSVDDGLARFDKAISRGLPEHRIGAFAAELISAGKYAEAAQLRLKY